MNDIQKIGSVLERARQAAIDYYRITGKPLGITGEYGEYIVAERLELELAQARTAGYDATDKAGRRIQIKARSIPSDKKLVGQRLGSIRLDQEWDIVLLVLMNERFEVRWIYEAEREGNRSCSQSAREQGAERTRGAIADQVQEHRAASLARRRMNCSRAG